MPVVVKHEELEPAAPEPTHVLVSVIVFDDGEESISYPYARGTRDHCEKTKSLIGGVAYSGEKTVISAGLQLMPADEYDALERESRS